MDEVTVYHLKQMHFDRSAPLDRVMATDVAMSQYNIAKQLWNEPGAYVFSEGWDENITAYNRQRFVSKIPNVDALSIIFEKGLPEKFENLTVEQRTLLLQLGAPWILLALGRTGSLLRTISRELQQEIKADLAEGGTEKAVESGLIFDRREKECLELISEYLKKRTPGSAEKVFLIFGGAHDFRALGNDFNLLVKPVETLRAARLMNWIMSISVRAERIAIGIDTSKRVGFWSAVAATAQVLLLRWVRNVLYALRCTLIRLTVPGSARYKWTRQTSSGRKSLL